MPGKFLPAKAMELGVPRGQLFGQLKGGQAVQLGDGTTVLPDQVTICLWRTGTHLIVIGLCFPVEGYGLAL